MFAWALAAVSAAPQCAQGPDQAPAPTTPSPLPRADLLADSEIAYETSGGIAGFLSGATFVARDGRLLVEYRPEFSRPSSTPSQASVSEDEFLAVWDEVEQSGVRTIPSTGEPQPPGADFFRYSLRLRIGDRTTTLVWYEEPPERPEAVRALVEAIVAAARDAAGAKDVP